MIFNHNKYVVLFLCTLFITQTTTADTYRFVGQIETVDTDNGQSYFSGVGIGEYIQGEINSDTAEGVIHSNFNPYFDIECCHSAGGVITQNNYVLNGATADLYNDLLGELLFTSDDIVDILNVEGDTITQNGTRLELRITFVLFEDSFDEGVSYSLREEDIQLTIAFVLEESMGITIYSSYGLVSKNSDNDVFPDHVDNCILVTNPSQLDSDNDGIGNACDPDIDNNCVVNFLDFIYFPPAFNSEEGDPNFDVNVDFSENGAIDFFDFITLVNAFGDPPGPSATACDFRLR